MASPTVQKSQEFNRQLRDKILAAAGIDLPRRLRQVARAYKRLERSIDAQKAIATPAGPIHVEDNAARLRAVELTMNLEGLVAGKQEEAAGPRTVQIIAPWLIVQDGVITVLPPDPIDVTPSETGQTGRGTGQTGSGTGQVEVRTEQVRIGEVRRDAAGGHDASHDASAAMGR
jgi:hypothetical protein